MRVSEVYLSLQGEGPNAGLPMVFVRLQGCNLDCRWCDTKYSWTGGEDKDIAEILREVNDYNLRGDVRWVCITGGEPLMQSEELEGLVVCLSNDYKIEVETNGSFKKPRWYDWVDCWVVDVKCPSSGQAVAGQAGWFVGRMSDCIKFVVADDADLSYMESMLRHPVLGPQVLVSPVMYDGGEKDKEWQRRVWRFCIENRLRFSMQQHKVLFGNRRGV